MGRQIHFYMLPEDRDTFIRVVKERDPVVLVARDDHKDAELRPVSDLALGDRETLCLWNQRILPLLQRKWVQDPGYYRVDEFRWPILEFTSSFNATWDRKPALGQGRLFGDFDQRLGKPPEFEKWYESIVRWIRKNYKGSPASLGGYLGPAALDFYNKGGYLLPEFLPPRTREWLTEIGKQHSTSKVFRRTYKRIRAAR